MGSPLQSWALRGLDRLGPRGPRDLPHHQRLRARAMTAGALATTVAWVAFAVKEALAHQPVFLLIDLTGAALSVCALVVHHRSRRLELAGNLLAAGVFAALAGLCAISGGLGLPAPFMLGLIPLGSVAVTTYRSGVAWTGLGLAILIALTAAHAAGVAFPHPVPEDTAVPMMLVGAVLTLLLTAGLALANERMKDSALEALMTTNRDLERARDEANAASTAKSRFLANMSHELRTPMNGILGSLQLLEAQRGLDAEGTDLAHTATSSARSLLTLLNEILDLARIEAGELSVQERPFDASALLHEVGRLFETVVRGAPVELTVTYPPDAPTTVVSDPDRVRQIVANLVSNAVKFTSQGAVKVAAAFDGAGEHRRMRISVSDTGAGIPAGDLERVFEAFEQGDDSWTRRHGGTGLGLTVSRHLAERLGGTLDAESAAGEGSTFTLRLPVRVAPSPPRPTPPAAGVEPGKAAGRLLLVEDNAVNRKVATRMLERLGYEVATSADGREAVDRCASEVFDAIIMDCHMPNMDGWQATRVLRRRGLSTPILALTASAMQEDRERCRRVGMNAFLAKPVEREALRGALERCLGARDAPPAE